jgi:hypothetical protein
MGPGPFIFCVSASDEEKKFNKTDDRFATDTSTDTFRCSDIWCQTHKTLFSLSLMKRPNKLERLSVASLCQQSVFLEKGSLTLLTNIRLGWIRLAKD